MRGGRAAGTVAAAAVGARVSEVEVELTRRHLELSILKLEPNDKHLLDDPTPLFSKPPEQPQGLWAV